MMKKNNKWIAWSVFALVGGLMMQSCHESLEERAARECKEYTERNCPQQLGNGVAVFGKQLVVSIYDSLTFEIPTQTVHHHYSVTGEADNAQAFAEHKDELRKAELEGLRRDISTQKYKEAGYKFAITIRSGRNPKNVYFHTVFTPEELK